MAKRQRMPKAIQNLLDTRRVKLRRLLDQTSPNKASLKHEKGIHYKKIVLEMLRQEKIAVAAAAA